MVAHVKSGLELAPGPGGDPVQSALGYLVALSSTAAALLLSLGLEARFGSSSFALLFAAVMLSAWYGGLGPGLLSTVIGGLAADYYLEFPFYSLRLASPQTALRLGLFVLVALFISSLSARLRTARAVAEGARREAQRAAAIVASSQDAIVGVDRDGRIVEWNQGAADLFGRLAGDVLGQPVAILQPTDRPTELARVVERLMAGERFGAYETVGQRSDGGLVDLSVTVSPVHGPEDSLVGAALIGRDVTARKQLEEVRANLAAIVSSSDDAIFGATLEGEITSWNRGAERLYGYRPDEVIGHGRELLLPSDRVTELARLMERVGRGETVDRLATQRRRKDGRLIDVVVSVSPIRSSLGDVVGVATVTRDRGALGWDRELAELARALAREPSAERQLATAVEALRRLLGADSASALRWQSERGTLVPAGSSPPTSDTSETRPGEGAAGRAVRERAAVVMNDYPTQPGATAAAVRAGTRAAIAVPVFDRGALVGVLVAGSRAPEARYGDAEAELVEIVAALAAPGLAGSAEGG